LWQIAAGNARKIPHFYRSFWLGMKSCFFIPSLFLRIGDQIAEDWEAFFSMPKRPMRWLPNGLLRSFSGGASAQTG